MAAGLAIPPGWRSNCCVTCFQQAHVRTARSRATAAAARRSGGRPERRKSVAAVTDARRLVATSLGGSGGEVLSAVRRALSGSISVPARNWWREYQVELLLAAHRTFKWTGDLQTPGTWRAPDRCGGGGSEALDGEAHSWACGGRAAVWLSAGEAAAPAARQHRERRLARCDRQWADRARAGVGWSGHVRHEVRAAGPGSRPRSPGRASRAMAAGRGAEHEAFIDLDAEVPVPQRSTSPGPQRADHRVGNASRSSSWRPAVRGRPPCWLSWVSALGQAR